MEYIGTTKKIAIAVLRALRRRNPAHDASSDPEALIAEVAICNAVCMHFAYCSVFTLLNVYHVYMV